MRCRLESFKSAKMGVAPPKTISKHTKKDQQQKVSVLLRNLNVTYMEFYTIVKKGWDYVYVLEVTY